MTKANPKEAEEVAVSELCLTFHTVTHNMSYRSSDCNIKLIKNLFYDSKICQSVQCRRTKMEALAKNVLYPLSIQMHLNAITSKKFSISSDSSSKGNVKVYPIGVQYFDVSKGIINFVLDFYEDPNERSIDIFNHLKQSLIANNLSLNNVIAFTGDNASVNYAKFHSVYKYFTEVNHTIVKANCNCHILHNTAKYALLLLPFDVENLVIKIYSHFSISAKRVQNLKSCYEYSDNEYESMKRHVTTRWLSLYPAINRIIDNINEIKLYFVGLGTDECPHIINEFVWSDNTHKISLPEMYLQMTSHLMKLFHINIKTLESKTTNATNLYHIMSKIKGQLENRLQYEFFGSYINENIKHLTSGEQKEFLKNTKQVYKRAIDYFEKHFDLYESPFKLFSKLNLDEELRYEDLISVSNLLNINVDKDLLFDEIQSFNLCLNQLSSDDKKLDNIAKYCKILSNIELLHMTKIIETVMAIPVGNEFVERVFSLMKKVWRDDRSHMNIDLIKSEICIKSNFSMDCIEFKSYIKDNENVLKAVKCNDKYK